MGHWLIEINSTPIAGLLTMLPPPNPKSLRRTDQFWPWSKLNATELVIARFDEPISITRSISNLSSQILDYWKKNHSPFSPVNLAFPKKSRFRTVRSEVTSPTQCGALSTAKSHRVLRNLTNDNFRHSTASSPGPGRVNRIPYIIAPRSTRLTAIVLNSSSLSLNSQENWSQLFCQNNRT